ncbi:MAG: hypothetical protein RL033_4599, partial [Pseudomonadota bacterium]
RVAKSFDDVESARVYRFNLAIVDRVPFGIGVLRRLITWLATWATKSRWSKVT